MNKKQVVKAVVTYRNQDPQQMYGIVHSDSNILLENGDVCDMSHLQISATRNVSPEIRASLENAYTDYSELVKLYKQNDELQKRISNLRQQVYTVMPQKIREAKGEITKKEFVEVFHNNLSSDVLGELKKQKFSYDTNEYSYTSFSNANKCFYITREVYIEKYYREENEICYQEYDGTMFIKDGAEKTKTYKDYIKHYSHLLPVKAKPMECLAFGDKSTLMYICQYEIPVKKPLTKEYAKQLAKEFCATDKTKKYNYEK